MVPPDAFPKGDPIDRVLDQILDRYSTLQDRETAESYKDWALAMLFLKTATEVSNDCQTDPKQVQTKAPRLASSFFGNGALVVPTEANFNTLSKEREKPGNYSRVQLAFRTLESENVFLQGFSEHFFPSGMEYNKKGTREEIIRQLLEFINNIESQSSCWIDKAPEVYESLIRRFSANPNQKLPSHYTPPEVSDLLSAIVAPRPGDMISDPACGSGSLLLRCGRTIASQHNSHNYYLFGQEKSEAALFIARMNMILHGETQFRLEGGDTLSNPQLIDESGHLKLYDVVVSEPPFSVYQWGNNCATTDIYGRFTRGIPPESKGNFAFILHMLKTLRPSTGRMGVVMPHGVLFRGSKEYDIRRQLIDENLLDAIISLPEKLFYDSNKAAVILIFKQNRDDSAVLFVDARKEFEAGKHNNRLTKNGISNICDAYQKRSTISNFSYLASFYEIRSNDYNLHVPRYVDCLSEDKASTPASLLDERNYLDKQLADVDKRIDQIFNELGLG